MVDYYRVLGVGRDASSEEIKAAFRRLALKFHPDRHANASKSAQQSASDSFRQVKEAYEVLGNQRQRDIYNRSGGSNYSSSTGTSYSSSSSSSAYSSAYASRAAYERASQQNRYRAQQQYDGFRSDWSYRDRYTGPRRAYEQNVRWSWASPTEGPRIMLRTILFGMAFFTIIAMESSVNSAWKYKNNGRVVVPYHKKSYEEMVERLEQEKRVRERKG